MRFSLFQPVFNRKKKVNWRRRLVGWAVVLGLIVGGYYWQPLRYELFPPEPPDLARVSPEELGLFREGTRVLIVAGHPDDSEFYMGGTLLQMERAGVEVLLVCMTDGDKAYYPFGAPDELTKTRREEQTRAAREWGGRVVFLGFRDGRLPVSEKAQRLLLREIESFRPDIVFSADPVYRPRRAHRDHTNAGENTVRALRSYSRDVTLLLYSTRAANCFVDIASDWERKMELVAIHDSQFGGRKMDFISNMLARRALEAGDESGLPMAEPFRVVSEKK